MWHTSALGLFVCRDFYLKTSIQHVMMCHRSHRRVAKMRISHGRRVARHSEKYLIIRRKNSRRAMFTARRKRSHCVTEKPSKRSKRDPSAKQGFGWGK